MGMGELLLALVFFASGAVLIKNAKAPAASGSGTAKPVRGFAAMASKPKFALGIFMLVLGALVSMYWLVMRL